ncbi:MAG: pseudouridine synthase [Acidobacteriota bacterium]
MPNPSRSPRPSWTVLPPTEAPGASRFSTVLDYLIHRFPRVPSAVWRRRMERGLVFLEGEGILGPDDPYRPHARVGYYREVEAEPRVPFEERILHVDRHLVVVDKPPFLPVTPGGPFVNECLLYRVERRLGVEGLSPVHRLDRLTSGLVLLARHADARRAYAELFARQRIHKVYSALCRMPSRPNQSRWRVRSRIVQGEPFFRMEEATGVPNAETHVTLLHWRRVSHLRGVGRVRLVPRTGKKHQLRVHLARMGWPIFGDRLYPELQPEKPDDFDDPLRLNASALEYVDPFDGHPRRWASPAGRESLGVGLDA